MLTDKRKFEKLDKSLNETIDILAQDNIDAARSIKEMIQSRIEIAELEGQLQGRKQLMSKFGNAIIDKYGK